jgi:hypothetical protein
MANRHWNESVPKCHWAYLTDGVNKGHFLWSVNSFAKILSDSDIFGKK